MKKILAATAFLAVGMLSANAADLPARTYTKAPPMMMDPVYSWTGWYIGANGGGAFEDRRTGTFGGSNFPVVAITAGAVPASLGTRHEGYFGGGQIGYNWQAANFVYGLEADIQGADIGKRSVVGFPGAAVGGVVVLPTLATGRDHLDWFGTFRGRVGFAVDRVLFYGTGGLAYGETRTSATLVATPITGGNFAGNVTDTRVGYAVGAGIEWAFAPNWSVKGEYLHIDLGRSDVTIRDPAFAATSATYRFRHEFDSARVGINYKWGGPVVARY